MTSLIEAVLREGVDDWVPFRTVHALAYVDTDEADERSVRQSAIDAVRELVASGLVNIGVVTDAGFSAWSAPLFELDGFAAGYLAAGESTEKDWGFRLWLANTPAGDRRGQQVDRSGNSSR